MNETEELFALQLGGQTDRLIPVHVLVEDPFSTECADFHTIISAISLALGN